MTASGQQEYSRPAAKWHHKLLQLPTPFTAPLPDSQHCNPPVGLEAAYLRLKCRPFTLAGGVSCRGYPGDALMARQVPHFRRGEVRGEGRWQPSHPKAPLPNSGSRINAGYTGNGNGEGPAVADLRRSQARAKSGRPLLDLFEHRAGLERVGRVECFLCHEDLLHDPLTIDDERRPAGDDVLLVEDAVGSANVSLGVA
jgi:hypothetical protein